MELIEQITGIVFRDKSLLNHAFIHRSYLNEHKTTPGVTSNEKLEFLGDSVLSLTTSIYLFKFYPELDEGIYTDIKASVVRTETLAEVAKSLRFGEAIYLSKGEELNGGRENKNILADCFESYIAALFLDQGFEHAFQFIVKHLFEGRLAHIVENKLYLSPKSRLQEIIQAMNKTLPQYTLVSEIGPEHKKTFEVTVSFGHKTLGKGVGMSKKEAEENAAKNALEILKK
jgi:ribonuclease-3